MKTTRAADATDKFIGAQIRAARDEKVITRETLANALDVSPQMVQKFEFGTSRLAARQLMIVSRLTGHAADWFFPPLEDKPTSTAKRTKQ